MIIKFIILSFCFALFSCNSEKMNQSGAVSIPNPASVKCIEDGHNLEIRRDDVDGGEFGVCINEDGDECDEWEYFRDECSL
jgi:uncharacterized protein